MFCSYRKIHSKAHIESPGTLKSESNFGKEEQSWRSHTF